MLKKHLRRVLDYFDNTYYPAIAAILIFLATGIYLAARMKTGLPPDEIYHYKFIKFYTDNSLLPLVKEQNNSFFLGDITRVASYLYHYLFSIYARLVEFSGFTVTYAWLRILNLLIGVLSLCTVIGITKKLQLNKRVANTSVIVIANMPMFIILSSSINYDNLFILEALLFTLALITIARSEKIKLRQLLVASLIMFLGLLTKFTFLPIAFAGVLCVVYFIFKKPFRPSNIFGVKNKEKVTSTLLIIGVLIFSLLFVERYVYNFIAYRSFQPSCREVHTHQQCLNNYIYNRSVRLNANPPPTEHRKDPVSYTLAWVEIMNERIYGVHAHKDFLTSNAATSISLVLFTLMLISGIRYVKMKELRRYGVPLLLFAVYVLALIYENYTTYLTRNRISMAVQGRYIFPVLFPIIPILFTYLYKPLKNKAIAVNITTVLIVLFSLAAGIPYLIYGFENWLV